MERTYDVFVSHAWEDKPFVKDLSVALAAKGLDVWYDGFVLSVGDNLSRKIDEGLANSRFGIIVLSRSFFTKSWTQHELSGLWQRQNHLGQNVILPIWYGISKSELMAISPTLCDLVAITDTSDVLQVAEDIIRVVIKAGKPVPHGLSGYLQRFTELIDSSPSPEYIQAFVKLSAYDTISLNNPLIEQFYSRMKDLYRAKKVIIDYILLLNPTVTPNDIPEYLNDLKQFASQIATLCEGDKRLTTGLTQSNIVVFNSRPVAFTHDRDAGTIFSGAQEWSDSELLADLRFKVSSISHISTVCYSSPRRQKRLKELGFSP